MAVHYRLCLILTRSICALDPLRTIEEAVQGGVDMIQVREKDCSSADLLAWSQKVVGLGNKLGVPVIINDSVEVAIAAKASGVHLGQDDLNVADARKLLGDERLIGLSTHDLEQLDDAALAGADYVGFGPIFPTATKGNSQGIGVEQLIGATVMSRLPMLAIGGITVENAWMLPGKAGIAVSSAICGSEEPGKMAHSLCGASLY
ncbi:MAG: thiamine phosphate synthase [Planctomycetota bacterium]|jgi:thiamine-phosphate pyrophosphorylase|nr:thiamine phosphate synthase [Planctomycetota bacterium]